jgi:hypothetical protein
MKPRHMAMGAALSLAAGLLAFGDRSPQGEVAEAVERPAAASVRTAPPARRTEAKPVPPIARLLPRETVIGDGKDSFNAGDGADDKADKNALFGRQDWTPPPPPPPKPAPPPPPTAPPLPYTVIGKSLEDGKWEVYLASGQNAHIAHEGAVLEGAWRIDRIAPPLMTLTYLPLNQVQQLNIGVFE